MALDPLPMRFTASFAVASEIERFEPVALITAEAPFVPDTDTVSPDVASIVFVPAPVPFTMAEVF